MSGSFRAIMYAFAANLGIAIAKGLAAWYTRSGAMLAEAIHSVADTTNQILLIVGLRRAEMAASDDHPLGYGKAVYFWSFVVAIMLFSMGGIFSIYEGLHKMARPEMPESPWIAVAVLTISLVMEFGSLKGALAEIKKVRGNRSLWRWFRTSRQSELIVVVGEDSAALVGLSLALLAVLATIITSDPLYDALGSTAIGAVLILIAIAVGVEVKSLLIGESADPETVEALRQFLSGRPEIAKVYHVITLQLGSDIMVSVKAKMQEGREVDRMIEDINRVEAELKTRFPQVRWTFFEPDVRD